MNTADHTPSAFETRARAQEWAVRSGRTVTLRDANVVTVVSSLGSVTAPLPPYGGAGRSAAFDRAVQSSFVDAPAGGHDVAVYVGGLLVMVVTNGAVTMFADDALTVGVLRE